MDDYYIISKKNKNEIIPKYIQTTHDEFYLITINDTPYCFTNNKLNAKNIVHNISLDIQKDQKLKYPHCNYNINFTNNGSEIVSNNHYNIVLVDLVEFYIKYKQITFK